MTLSLLIFGKSYANNRLNGFNKWLFKNGYTEYVEKTISELCKDEPKGSVVWYTIIVTNLNIRIILI